MHLYIPMASCDYVKISSDAIIFPLLILVHIPKPSGGVEWCRVELKSVSWETAGVSHSGDPGWESSWEVRTMEGWVVTFVPNSSPNTIVSEFWSTIELSLSTWSTSLRTVVPSGNMIMYNDGPVTLRTVLGMHFGFLVVKSCPYTWSFSVNCLNDLWSHSHSSFCFAWRLSTFPNISRWNRKK